jgi:RHS repeat-associated protein
MTVSGLLHLRNRDYDAETGTFTTPDPLDGVDGTPTVGNPYHYADNDPLNRVDPLGLSATDDDIGPNCLEGEVAWEGKCFPVRTNGATGAEAVVTICAVHVTTTESEPAPNSTVTAAACLAAFGYYLALAGVGVVSIIASAHLPGSGSDDCSIADDECPPETLYHYTDDTGRRLIEWEGQIRPSGEGGIFLTPDAYTSGEDAQQMLALTRVRPSGYFAVPVDRIQDLKGPREVREWPPGAGNGGGTEYWTSRPIDARGLQWVDIGP